MQKEPKIHCDMEHRDIHERVDAIQKTQDALIEEFRGFREDISPMVSVFKSIQVYMKGGKFMGTVLKGAFILVAGVIGMTWTSIQIINYFTK